MKTIKGYRFVTKKLESEHGKVKWEIGKWNKLDSKEPLCLCRNGFHASQKPIGSLNYRFGTRWFECEAKGEILKDSDKFCATEMRLVREIPVKVLQQFAIDCAYRVLPSFEKKYPNDNRPRLALEAAQEYLNNPTKKNKDTLGAAADSAGYAADSARYAAYSTGYAAYSAGYSAYSAGRAAYSAGRAADSAWYAADSAGRAAYSAAYAERKRQNKHLLNLIRKVK